LRIKTMHELAGQVQSGQVRLLRRRVIN
jgi:hypothetical protein